MHIILGVSPVSVGPCMCAVRTQVTEDRPLKKCNCTTSTAQDQPSAGQGNIELSLKRGRGCAACTAHRESYGGAGPGVAQPVLRVPVARGRWLPRTQCRQEQRSIKRSQLCTRPMKPATRIGRSTLIGLNLKIYEYVRRTLHRMRSRSSAVH